MATETLKADEDRLPWLEAVEDEDDKTGPSAAKLIGALLIGLVAIAAVIFAFFQLGHRDSGPAGEPEIITADAGNYKQRPDAVGGMKVEGEGDTAFAASEGADPNGRINLDAIPESPVAGAKGIAPAEQLKVKPDARSAQAAPNAAPVVGKPVPAVKPTPAPAPVQPPVATPVVAPAAGGGTVQLGAFSSNAAAQTAWKSMSGRFASLKPLTNSVVSASVGGKTVYRLRANVGSHKDANTLCGKLKVAGESCAIID